MLVIIIVSHPESRHAGKGAVTQRPHVSSRPSTQSPSNTGVEREDARGDLVLEGQVLDSASQPVGGVSVSLNAFPPRTIVTEEDGSFSFTGLIERRYQVTAASASGVAGPVEISLQANTDPLILRLVRPGRVVVKVVNAASQAPIAGATVDVRTPIVVTGQTRADGTVELSPVVQGHWDVVATAA
ncbi:MAG TPA: carboxypeptidase regulatory-like domain-containing protein, partial [Kofleriaceae bacterium]